MSLDLGIPDPPPAPRLSAAQRRTLRQVEQLRAGWHPVRAVRLADGAPPVDDRMAPGPRCGTCAHLYRWKRGRTYLKCDLTRATRGAGTDLRSWWPGCLSWAAVESGIVTFEEAFLPWTLLPSGATVCEEVGPQVEAAYRQGHIAPLQIEGRR